jgi:hypothetical protein
MFDLVLLDLGLPRRAYGLQTADGVIQIAQPVRVRRKLVQTHHKQLALLIQRGDARIFVPVTLG